MNILSKIFGNSAANIVKEVGGVLDNVITNREELIKAKAEAQKIINDHLEALEETAVRNAESARAREVAIQERGSFLTKNINSIIALCTLAASFMLWTIIVFYPIQPESKEIVLFILGALSTISAAIINYYFGSTRGATLKNETIKNLSDK